MKVLPKVYADFQNADQQGRLRLNCRGTSEDLARQSITLREGMALLLYSEDIEAEGVAKFSTEESMWVAVIDWQLIKNINDGTQGTDAQPIE